MSDRVKERILVILIAIIAFAVPFCLYWELFTTDKVFLSGDGIAYLVPRIFQKEAFLNGVFPFWNKYLENGIPFISDISMSPLYLPAIILSFLPIKYFVYCVYGFHIAVAGCFTFKYLKTIGCINSVSFCTALLYMLSIHLGGFRKNHMAIISSVVYLPGVLFYFEKYFQEREKKYSIYASFVLALQFFGPFVQEAVYTAGFASIYFFIKSRMLKCSIRKCMKQYIISMGIYIGIVSVQLFQTLFTISTYKSYGFIPTSIEIFKTYSISFYKIVMMLLPKWFDGNIYMPDGYMASSEMDIEIFLGVCVFSIIFFSAIRYRRDNNIKLFVVMLILSFVYAANAHVPFLGFLLYKIPGINGFRCPARVLFVFIFFSFVLFAYGLNLCLQKKEVEKLYKTSFIITSITFITTILRCKYILRQNIGSNFFSKYVDLFGCELVALCAFSLILFFTNQKKEINKHLLLAGISAITLWEIHPYYSVTSSEKVSKIYNNVSTTNNLFEEIGNSKVWDAFYGIDGAHTSFISQNASMVKKIPSLNAYIAMNNPNIFKIFSTGRLPNFNLSGLITGSLDAPYNIYFQNDVISMLGIKYLIDSSNIIQKNNIITTPSKIHNAVLLNINDLIIEPGKNLLVHSVPIQLKSNVMYKVEVEYLTTKAPEIFIVDFYGGEKYDFRETEIDANRGSGQNKIVYYMNSLNIPYQTKTMLRILVKTNTKIEIVNLQVSECIKIDKIGKYDFYTNVNGKNIYFNPNYKNILYTTQKVIPNTDFKKLYMDTTQYDFLTKSYVETNSKMLNNNDAQISEIKFGYNGITADIYSKQECFINFSQNYYPGWHAYVNNQETKLHMVNGVIQGMYVPAGNNNIEFRYSPVFWRESVILSLGSLCIAIYYIHKRRNF